MKIVTYKVPVTLTRVAGNVEITQHDEQRVRVNEAEETQFTSKQVVTMSKNVSDNNNAQMSIAKMTLGASEQSKDTHLLLKYIE